MMGGERARAGLDCSAPHLSVSSSELMSCLQKCCLCRLLVRDVGPMEGPSRAADVAPLRGVVRSDRNYTAL